MKSKLRRMLHNLLVQERISIDSGIVNYITYQLAEIELTDEKMHQGFSFLDNRYYQNESEQEPITFSIPTGFSLAQIKQLLCFFAIPEENYRYGESLVLSGDYLLESFFPKFALYVKDLGEKSPEIMSKYRVISAPLFESTAKNTLRKAIQDTTRKVLADTLKELTTTRKSVIDFILLLSGRMQALESFPLFYKDILRGRENINEFLQWEEIKADTELCRQFQQMLEAIELYERYNRSESVLANIALHREINHFLVSHKISFTTCDIIEDSILALAGAQMSSKSQCQFKQGYDTSRLVVIFGDINQENFDKIIQYMHHEIGDETCCEGYGYQCFGSRLSAIDCLESATSVTAERGGSRTKRSNAPVRNTRSIECDAKIFYERLFPLLREKVNAMAEQNLLGEYQELSKNFFEEESALGRASSLGVFSREPAPLAAAAASASVSP